MRVSRFIVDEKKCRRDGICVAVCPVGVLVRGETDPPEQVPGGAAPCISCGHCVAACPFGACSLDTMPSADCPPVRPEWILSPEQAEHFLRSRRSIRAFKDAAVTDGRLERLIRTARYAPSGRNGQPVRWLVVSGRGPVRAIAGHVIDWMRSICAAGPELGLMLNRLVAAWDAGRDLICRDAPHLIVTHAPKDDLTAPSACTLALAYLELAAPAHGLGACWAGYVHLGALHWQPLQQALALPAGDILNGALMLGEPRYRYHRLPARREPPITWR
jgi:nitroreductase/NAD-dependent dihydropyrimidine dehydrogenase PreA subunit